MAISKYSGGKLMKKNEKIRVSLFVEVQVELILNSFAEADDFEKFKYRRLKIVTWNIL